MMKKLVLVTASLLIVLFSFTSLTSYAAQERVYDDANLLSTSEERQLTEMAVSIQDEYGIDVVVATTTDTSGKSAMAYADDFYDYGGFSKDGILLLIDMQHRTVWISTTGSAIKTFTDARIDSILDNMASSMKAGNYFQAASIFMNDTEHYLVISAPRSIGQRFISALMYSPLFLLIAAAISALVTFLVSRRRKGEITVDGRTYANGGFNLKQQKDDLIDSNTTRVYVPPVKISSGGGGSSTHSGSSGTSHGGGGRSF